MGFLPEVIQNVLRNLANTVGVQQGLLVFRRTEFFLVLLAFNGFEVRANVVVVHLELEHLFITNGVGDHVRMQLPTEHAGSGVRAQGVLRENRRAGKAKLIELFEFLLQVFLGFTKLAAVAFIKNKHHLLVIDG